LQRQKLCPSPERNGRRAITSDEYWGKARAGMSKDEYKAMVEAFRGEMTESDHDAVRQDFLRQGRWQARAAALNDCHNAVSIMNWYKMEFEISYQIFGYDWITTKAG